ncbi:hypothetical protein VPHK250G1_0054 [Vibrio phage K250 g1]
MVTTALERLTGSNVVALLALHLILMLAYTRKTTESMTIQIAVLTFACWSHCTQV